MYVSELFQDYIWKFLRLSQMQQICFILIDWVVVFTSHSTQNRSFRRCSQAHLAWYEKTKPNTTKARIHQSKEMYYNTK